MMKMMLVVVGSWQVKERRGDWRVGSPSSQHQAANTIANTVNCELEHHHHDDDDNDDNDYNDNDDDDVNDSANTNANNVN